MGRIFSLIALIARLLGFLLTILVIVNFSGWLLIHSHLSQLTYSISYFLPDSIAGKWVVPTPLDGLFRTDFAIAAFTLFFVDWIFCMVRKACGK